MHEATPTQSEVDSVAAFVEAAYELENEPFFQPDSPLSMHESGGSPTAFEFGDRYHFRSALVTFRRLWMNDEPSHVFSCLKIIGRYANDQQRHDLKAKRKYFREFMAGEWPGGPEYPHTKEIIDTWLYSVFAHNQVHTSRARFQELCEIKGSAHFEYVFRYAVWWIGLKCMEVAKIYGGMFLALAKNRGLEPSFSIGLAFGSAFEEKNELGQTISRKSSTAHHHNETTEERTERFWNRPQHQSLKTFLQRICLEGFETGDLLETSTSLESTLREAGISLSEVAAEQMSRSDFAFHDFPSRQNVEIQFSERGVSISIGSLRILERLLAEIRGEYSDWR